MTKQLQAPENCPFCGGKWTEYDTSIDKNRYSCIECYKLYRTKLIVWYTNIVKIDWQICIIVDNHVFEWFSPSHNFYINSEKQDYWMNMNMQAIQTFISFK